MLWRRARDRHAPAAHDGVVAAPGHGLGQARPRRAAPIPDTPGTGIGHAGRTVDREGNSLPLEHFEKVIRITLTGTFNCLRPAAAATATTEPVDAHGTRGAVVDIASVAAAHEGQIGRAAYSASKGGIIGLTLTTARDLSAPGIRGNTIAPGTNDYVNGETIRVDGGIRTPPK